MKNISRVAPFLLAISLALLPANRGSAQSDAGGGALAEAGATGVEPVTLENVRFDVEFVDTPAPDAFEFIAQQLEELGAGRINIVYSKTAEAITLPTMALRQVSFEQFVNFVNQLGGARSHGGAGDDPFAGDSQPFFPEHTGPRFGITDNDGIWYFWAEQSEPKKTEPKKNHTAGRGGGFDAGSGMGGSSSSGGSEKITRVFALSGEAEPVLGLIEEALGAAGQLDERAQPSLKYHEPSSTLIVSGSNADLQLIDEVISLIENRDRIERQEGAESMTSGMAQEIQALRQELEFTKRRAEEEQARISARAEQEILTLKTELTEARGSYSKPHPKMVELQAQLDKALEELEKKK